MINQQNMNNAKNGHSFLLDTNACIKYLKGDNLLLLQKLSVLPKGQIVLCDIVKFELYYGAYKSTKTDKNLVTLDNFFSNFSKSLPFDDKAIVKAAQVRAELAKKGLPIGPTYKLPLLL